MPPAENGKLQIKKDVIIGVYKNLLFMRIKLIEELK